MQDTVYKFQKNATEEVRVGTEEYKGVRYIDIRCYLPPPLGPAEGKPTPKGIKIRIDQLPELEKGIAKLRKALDKTGTKAKVKPQK